ncbi:DUF1330 domain-containing protein [Tropicimonas sp. TH_r6]|uniref:DUF1330 domain-containing protein n=1 Tax=Tropicimonas sp. TH_r6 TaxID=3082085 RepID=UPI002953038F|nr:DUF1330 domain-containing protein [Tropicimonas sp. TH_r6]MDV7145866.1 DUF1330 domain-containing protein [Tropicimonas sp. TH_r6]
MTAYSVLFVTPTDEAWIPGYLAPVSALIEKHGGKYLARTADHQQLEGEDFPAALRVVLEWPAKENALNFENDPDYAPFLAQRLAGSNSYHFVLEGKDDLA